MPRSHFSSPGSLFLAMITLLAAWSASAAPCTTDGTSSAVSYAAVQSPTPTDVSPPVSSSLPPTNDLPSVSSSLPPTDDLPSVTPSLTTTNTSPPEPTSTSTDPAQPTSTGGSEPGHGGMQDVATVATGWYAAWMDGTFPPSSIPWAKYNMMTFAFALTTEDPSVLDLDQKEETLKAFASEAKKNNATSLISVGGWTGSQHFSTAVATEEGRAAFQKAILGMVSEYKLDGVDFDWEYPNSADGADYGCNTKSPQDAENFLTFLKGLRADPAGANLVLTAAVSLKPFRGPDGNHLTDVSGFAEPLDFLAIMNYDVFGSWAANTGPNAPLKDSCAPTADQLGSAESAVAAWTSAGFPANQILLGVAAYGHSFHVELSAAKSSAGSLNAYAPFDKTNIPLGEGETTSTPTENKCGVMEGPSGVWSFRGMIESGLLGADGNPGEGTDYTFDECSQTPFLYQQENKTLIAFDDAKSFTAKGAFINEKDLRGFAVWHVLGDSSDDILLDAIHEGLGTQVECTPDDGTADTNY